MDIWNHKTILQARIKCFTLKATASAVLTLNAEAVMADNCPTEIYGNTLAGIICNFNGVPPSGNSVTVENGGAVGGIQMMSYQPTDSYITVDAGGQVSNTTTLGIAIKSGSSLSNGISNNGTISAQSGIGISSNSQVNGGISNSGLISTVNAGVSVSTSTIANGITNSGTISSTSGVGLILHTSTINGGIFNSGVIDTNTTSITIGSTIGGHSIINGDIFNSGTINSHVATGIKIETTAISGSIFNSGTISGRASDSGITLGGNSTIGGDITNQGLINAITGNGIALTLSAINGGILNNGVIESAHSNAIALHDISTVQGSITNNGLLSGGQNGIEVFSSSTVGGITNRGTISGGSNGLNIYLATVNGNITNTGTISGDLTGINISSAAVNGAISNSGTIQGSTNAILVTGGGSTVNNIDILGQSARIIGVVEAANTTVNITNGAIFTSEGSYHVNLFNIASNALFNMANTITTTTVNNSGTLAVAAPLQTIVGDYTQQTGGKFQTDVANVSNYGQLAVTGTADLSQSGDIYVQLTQDPLLHNGDVLTNVISGSTLIVPTNGFNVSDNSYIWTFAPTLNNASNGVNLTASINPDAYNVCRGTYCQGALTAIIGQVAAGDPTFTPYATLPNANALREAASQATPELTNENIQVVQLITRAVLDVAPMWNTLRGKSSGDAMLYQPGKIWIKPYGASMTQNERSTVQGFNATAYGAVIGKDIQLPNDWLFGGGFAAGGDNMHGKSVLSGQSINSQAYQGILYGAKKFPNHVYFAGQGLVGYERNDTNRSIPLYASTAKGSYNSWFTNLRAETGWSTYVLSPNFVFTPELDASYLFINQNGYRESGSLMDLLVASNHNSSLVLGAYGNGAYHLTSIHQQQDLTFTGYAGVAGDVINSQPQVLSTFVASGSTFSTFGVQFNGVVFRGGAGVKLTNPMSPLIVELNYDLQVGNNAYSGIGAATIKYKT